MRWTLRPGETLHAPAFAGHHTSGGFGAASRGPPTTTGRTAPLRFRFHVAMAGGLGLGGDLTGWSEAELAEAAALVARYKQIRPLVQRGRRHRLTGGGGVTAVHHASEDGTDHAVLVWRPVTRFGHQPPPALALPALDPTARYLDPDEGIVHSGAVLTRYGLELRLPPGDYASRLIPLRRVAR
ncbi:GH36 C-terminal domain-containing protein [Kitasatospora sp. NPDC101801]|uniref:GH36 C-terminal domain-containing protein n=1 Tax=Kitasatospora sp. NPDC101801 TaxID=3364103 RepID=UPI0037FFCF28